MHFEIEKVLISFSRVNDLYKKEIYIDEHIDKIFNDYLLEKKINRNDVILKYKNKQFNLSQTIIQFISEYNIKIINEDKKNEIIFDVVDIKRENVYKNNNP